MQFIVLTDIFGENAWTQSFLQINQFETELGIKDSRVIVLSPYAEGGDFQNEMGAYDAFLSAGGMDKYAEKVTSEIDNLAKDEPKVIVGFSAGGAVAWLMAEEAVKYGINQVFAFYPGQIRHHLDINPRCDVTIFFPESERHFSLEPVIRSLKDKANTNCWQNNLEHGYINPNSKHYDSDASRQVQSWLQKLVLNFERGKSEKCTFELPRLGYSRL